MQFIIKNKVAKNASWIIISNIVQAALGFFISMFTARYLGPSNFGIINYAASLVAFVIPIMNLGLSNILVQEVINKPDKTNETLGTAIFMSLLSAIACIIGITAFSYIANPGETETVIVCALYSTNLLFQAIDLIKYWFQAKLLSKHSSLVSLVAYIITSIYKIFLLISGKSVRWFALSHSIDYLIIAFFLVIIYKKLENKNLKFSFTRAREMFSKSRYYIISSLMVTIFAQTDRIMIKHMLGNNYTGFYSAAVACASITSFVFSAIIDSFRAIIFEKKKENEQAYHKSLMQLYCVIIYLSLLQSLFITLFSKYIIMIIYGNQYLDAIPALKIIVWYTTFSYLGSVRNIWILSENKQKYLWIINLSGASFNVVLNYFLIPVWGICGASLASLITQIFTNVIIGYIMKPIRENNQLMVRSLNIKNVFNTYKGR